MRTHNSACLSHKIVILNDMCHQASFKPFKAGYIIFSKSFDN